MHMYQYHTASLHSECPRCGKDVNPGDNAHRRLSDGLVFCDRCHSYGLIPEAPHEKEPTMARKTGTIKKVTYY